MLSLDKSRKNSWNVSYAICGRIAWKKAIVCSATFAAPKLKNNKLGMVWVSFVNGENTMITGNLRFAVCNRHGLRFTIFAKDRASACKRVMQMLGKPNVPEYIWVAPY